MRRILRFHLAASALAALMATVFALEDRPELAWILVVLVSLAFLKPYFASRAWWLEHSLHRSGDQEHWVHARVLAELCHGAVTTWPLPIQPMDASDEEDFPKVKRLIRTLRLLREQDKKATIQGTKRGPDETQLEADMRAACAIYIQHRLDVQAGYYANRHQHAKGEAIHWRRGFIIATCTAITVGLGLAVNKILWATGEACLVTVVEHGMEAVVIIAPFVAAHCLGMMALLDCRRRDRRYEEMRHYLTRLSKTLARTQANPSRIRLIEHAERLMIEEHHEWFSVMRNLSV